MTIPAIDLRTAGLVAGAIYAIVAAVKSGKLGVSLSARWRQPLAIVLGAVAACLQVYALGADWPVAIATAGVGTLLATSVVHDLGIETVCGGREVLIELVAGVLRRVLSRGGAAAVLLLLGLAGCFGRDPGSQAKLAQAAVEALGQTVPAVVLAYQLEAEQAVQGAQDEAAAVDAYEAVRARWAPVWASLAAVSGACADIEPEPYVAGVDGYIRQQIAMRWPEAGGAAAAGGGGAAP